MTDDKVSLLINRQVPEFVREEYPLFVTFLEAYYEFLEQKQGTQLNDLTTRSKDLRYISDVDQSIDDFEESFFDNEEGGDTRTPYDLVFQPINKIIFQKSERVNLLKEGFKNNLYEILGVDNNSSEKKNI